MADTTGTERILNRLRGRAALWTFSALVPVVFLTLVVMEPFVYVLGGEQGSSTWGYRNRRTAVGA